MNEKNDPAVACPRCDGSGDDPSSMQGVRTCSNCNGSGLVKASSVPIPEGSTICPQCWAWWPHHHMRDGNPIPRNPPPGMKPLLAGAPQENTPATTDDPSKNA